MVAITVPSSTSEHLPASVELEHHGDANAHADNEEAPSLCSSSDITSIIAASFIIVFTACGLSFAFGVYQELYQELSHQRGNPFTGASPAQIDLIGTLSISLMTIGAPYTVAWSRRYSPRSVAVLGGVVFRVASLLASLYIASIVHHGIFASAYVALFPTSLVELFGIEHFASVNSALYMLRGLSTLVGTPVGGALVRIGGAHDATARNYEGMALLAGLLLVGAKAAVGWVRIEAIAGRGNTRPKIWRI